MEGSKNYLKVIIFSMLTFGAFIGAVTFSYFGIVGLSYGQGIVEQDVIAEEYKYTCNETISQDEDCLTEGGSYTTTKIPSYAFYVEARDELNDLSLKFLVGLAILFVLLTLLFLFLALESAGIWKQGKSSMPS